MHAQQFARKFLAESTLPIEFAATWNAPANSPEPGLQFGIVKTSEYWQHLSPSTVSQKKMAKFVKALRKNLPKGVIKGKAVVLSTGLACMQLHNGTFAVIAPYFRDADEISFTKGPQVVTSSGVKVTDEFPLRFFSKTGKLLGQTDYWNPEGNLIPRFANQLLAFSKLQDFERIQAGPKIGIVKV